MQITYQSENYDPADIAKRYVRYSPLNGEYHWCVTSRSRGLDLQQGIVKKQELPPHVAAEARDRVGSFPSYVEWPLCA